MKILFLFISLVLLQTNNVFAEADMANPLNDIKVTKNEIKLSLDKLKADGQISEADYKKAIEQLGGLNDTQISLMKDAAIGMVKNDPDKAVEVLNSKKINTPEVQKQLKDLATPKPQ